MTSTNESALPPEAGIPPAGVQAVLRPFARPGRGYWLLVAALTAVVGVGLVAWIIQLRDGMAVAGYNNLAFWAVYIADAITFIGVSYGGAVISAILRLTGAPWRAPLSRLAEATAVVTVLIGTGCILPHLGKPQRIWELVTRPNLSSPVAWDFIAIMTYTAGSIIFFVLPLVADMAVMRRHAAGKLGWRRRLFAAISRGWVDSPRQRRVLAGALGLISIMIIPLAVSVHSVLSWDFSLTSRPWYHESIWAPSFVVAALYSGVALVILVAAGFRRAYHLEQFITQRHFVRLGFILASFAAAYLYLTFADFLPGAYVGEGDTAAVFSAVLIGRYAIWFWLFIIGAGLIPLLLIALPWTRNTTGMVVASAIILPAMWLKRLLLVVAPANYDRVSGVFGAWHPTWVGLSITLAAAALIPLLLMLLFRVVPLLALHEMEEVAELAQPGESPVEHSLAPEPAGGGSPSGGRRRAFGAAGAVLLIVAGLGVLGIGVAGSAHAATAPAKDQTVISVTGENPGGATVRLTATLTTASHKPVAKAKIQFGESMTTFGSRAPFEPIGAVSTNPQGVATLVYQSTVSGNERFLASYAGGAGTQSASASTMIKVQAAHSAYHGAPRKPLAVLGDATRDTLLAIVALVWLTLIAQVVRVLRVSRHGATGTGAA